MFILMQAMRPSICSGCARFHPAHSRCPGEDLGGFDLLTCLLAAVEDARLEEIKF